MDPRSSPHFIQLDAPEHVVFSLAEGRTTLGRDQSNDFCLPDSSISREHCCFEREGGAVRVFDCNNKNPTRIGKELADGKLICDGDVLRLGRSRLLFKNPLASPKEQVSVVGGTSAATSEPASANDGSEARTDRRTSPGKWGARFPRRARSRRAALIAVVVLLVAVSLAGGIVIGHSILNGQGSGVSWSSVFGKSARSDDKADIHLSRRLQMIEEMLGKQADEISRIQAELESNRVRFENLPLHLQNEIEFFQRQNIDRQGRELAKVRGELSKLEGEVSDSPSPRSVTLEELGLKRIDEPRDTDVSVENYSGRTHVARPAVERKKLGSREIRDLVEALQRSLDEYAMPGITPDILQPQLGELSSALGKTAAKATMEVYDHGRALLRDIDTAMGVREKWVQGLLKKAEDEGLNQKGEGSASKGGYGAMGGKDHEDEQRLLELSAKKVAILKKQRDQLMTLQHAVLGSLISFTDPESTAFLADRFGSNEDRDLRLAILNVLARARAAHSVPKLTLRLQDRDEELRAAVHRTLVAITGEDLGDKAGPWRDWWEERKEG